MKRIAIRLLAFNLLLVFLPVAGVLYLGAYEARLESAEVRSITEQARIVAVAIGRDAALNPIDVDDLLARTRSDVRFRVLDTSGRVIADSRPIPPPRTSRGSPRHNTLYRVAVFVARPVLRLMQPPERPLDVDVYDSAERLRGPEVRAALGGGEGFDKKISAGGQRSVTLYRAVPIVNGGRVIGVALASASTYPILQDLYAVRLSVMRVFVATVVVAFLVSVFFSTTIVRPLRQLRRDARRVLDRRGGLRQHFKGSTRRDEIGELSRALERIMRRLDTYLRMIETFATDVSHELRNPLASIRNATEMLAEVNDPADRRHFVQMVEQEVARMEKLLAGVREISVIDARLGREEHAPLELGALLRKIVDGFRLREGERVRFELSTPEAPLRVDASEDRLIQVFENILDNAASFSPAGGLVRVGVWAEGGMAVTRLEDEGPGIPEAHMTRIFDRFFTYRPAAARRDSRHAGLGLAIVRAIVAGYGGTVTGANGERGAVFEVHLPAAEA